MTAGARYGLGVALTAIGLVLASAGLVSLVDGGGRTGDVPPIALDEATADLPPGGSGADDAGTDGAPTTDAGGRDAQGGVAIGPAGPVTGERESTTVDDDAAASDPSRATAAARSRRDVSPPTDLPAGPTAEPVQVPVGSAGTPDLTDVSPTEAPTQAVDDAPADEPVADDPPPSPTPTTPEEPDAAPAADPPAVDEPADDVVRGPARAGCDRGPDWPWTERAGNQGRGEGWGPPAGGCGTGGTAMGAVATVLAAPTSLGVHWLVRFVLG